MPQSQRKPKSKTVKRAVKAAVQKVEQKTNQPKVVKRSIKKYVKQASRRQPTNHDKFTKEVAVMRESQMDGARNLVYAAAKPSKCPPIHFPNLGDEKIGSIAVKEVMPFTIPTQYNATFNSGYQYAGIAVFPNYHNPCFYISAVGNTGTLTWTSIGSPPSYATVNSNMALVRIDTISALFTNYATAMYKNGVALFLNWQFVDSSGPNFPANIVSISNNGQARVVNLNSIGGKEFVPSKQNVASIEFDYPSSNAPAHQATGFVILFSSLYAGTNPSGALIEAIINMTWEAVPETANANVFPTSSTTVTEDAQSTATSVLSATGGATNNSRDPGLFGDLGDAFKSLYDVGKKIWDYAEPFTSVIGGILGAIFQPHERRIVMNDYYLYDKFLHATHIAVPTLFTARDYLILSSSFFGTHNDWRGKVRRVHKNPAYKKVFGAFMAHVHHQLHPVTKKFLAQHHDWHDAIPNNTLSVDLASLPAPFVVDGDTLNALDQPAALLGPLNGTLRPILSLYLGSYINNDSPPELICYSEGKISTVGLVVGADLRVALTHLMSALPPVVPSRPEKYISSLFGQLSVSTGTQSPTLPSIIGDDEKYQAAADDEDKESGDFCA